MEITKEAFAAACQAFTIAREELREAAAAFRYDIEAALQKKPETSLRMLPSYIGRPSGQERGSYLALDFGGTNIRVLKIELLGNGQSRVLKKICRPLRCAGKYDLTCADTPAEDLFDFLAAMVEEVLTGDPERAYRLGHTFSFPSAQDTLADARLISWTKEFATRGVEGQYVNLLLQQALQRRGLRQVDPVAVINDTVAVFLAAAYRVPNTWMGSIYATGHNTCYLEPYAGTAEPAMVLNMESGGFSKLLPNRYDQIVDEASEKPGKQRLEKMVSGCYMGMLFQAVAVELTGEKAVGVITSEDLSCILQEEQAPYAAGVQRLQEKLGVSCTAEDFLHWQSLAAAIVRRSARLAAATYTGVLWHLSSSQDMACPGIALDGSVYEKMPFVQCELHKALEELLGEEGRAVRVFLQKDGSGLGAAIAAAMAV